MQIYSDLPTVPISEEDVLAPFMGYDDQTAERLYRMSVMDENGELNETTIAVLSAAFASNFNDCLELVLEESLETVNAARGAIENLWGKGETTGTYLYAVLCCGMFDCPVPRELAWIARREDALSAYMRKFLEAMKEYEVTEESASD